MTERSEFRLGELVEIAVGGLWGSESPTEKENAPVRVIRGVDAHKMSQREVVHLPVRWVSAKQLLTRTLEVGDVVLESSGACGRSYVIRERDIEQSPIPLSFSNFSRRLVPDPKVNPAYLGYRLKQAFESGEIASYVTGTAMPNLDVHSALGGITVSLPSLSEQREIASILGALDDKIELNRRMNATLEDMARALFQSWFVDFDPVHAKAEGRQPVGMGAETAALFPDSFEESELGPIPKGWTLKAVSEVIAVDPKRTLPKASPAKYLDMKNLPTEGHLAKETIVRPYQSGAKYRNGDTLFARITPCLENGKTGFVDFLTEGEVGWGSTEFIVLDPLPPLPKEFGYLLARSTLFREFAIQNMTGTSGRQRVPAESFGQFFIAVPPAGVSHSFGGIAQGLFALINRNGREARRLELLRDSLIPVLLSGELRIGTVAA